MNSVNQMIDDDAILTTNQRVSCNGGGGPLGQAAIRISSQVKVPLVQPLVAACSEVSALIEHQLPHVQDVDR